MPFAQTAYSERRCVTSTAEILNLQNTVIRELSQVLSDCIYSIYVSVRLMDCNIQKKTNSPTPTYRQTLKASSEAVTCVPLTKKHSLLFS